MYRPEITVVDCTVRDGGLMNDSHFSLETVRKIYEACTLAGVDIIEVGYRNSKSMFSPDKYGAWRFCEDDLLKKMTDGIEKKAKIAIMQDAHKANADDVKPKRKAL